MKVYCIFSNFTWEEAILMHIVTTKEEAERVIAEYEAEYERDIANGDAFGGHSWSWHEEELLERVEITKDD
jgi:hypothetical protein